LEKLHKTAKNPNIIGETTQNSKNPNIIGKTTQNSKKSKHNWKNYTKQ